MYEVGDYVIYGTNGVCQVEAVGKIDSSIMALGFVEEIKDIEELWVSDEKTREITYKEAFRKHDCREYVRIIKTIYFRIFSRMGE